MRLSWSVPRAAAVALVPVAALAVTAAPAAAADEVEFTIEDERIMESSGLQASHRHPGVYWTHNDSGYAPQIFAVDSAGGRTVATVTLQGVEFRDVEAIHLGPDGSLYVGDIGDNFDGGWDTVWIYRFAEPEQLADVTVTPEILPVQYDDGPRDAEALMVHPGTGRVYIASKRDDGTAALYAGPERLTPDGVNLFRRFWDTDLWVTDGAFSPDGSRLLLRGYFTSEMFRWQDGGTPESVGLINVPIQPQGESVTFTPDGRSLVFGSEGQFSDVRSVGLRGERMPDSAREEASPGETGETGQDEAAGGPGPGGEDGSDGGATAGESDGDGGTGTGRMVVAAVAVAVLVFALRRAFRRGGGSRRA
ncbi:esterase-like activity of phytase family protein [Streptomyces sp. YIM 98790]|uniref:esterase-like activity of phytase family protein n=1 Tax=Streptomyces sp. YIM 98790 TaxID=2689077 RepID=UPI001FB76F3B|nr:esterase-like activity of phytase family protein [Streptomyces sp. YIM 98790]